MKTTLKELQQRKANREIRQIREREFGFNFVYFAWFAVESGLAADWMQPRQG